MSSEGFFSKKNSQKFLQVAIRVKYDESFDRVEEKHSFGKTRKRDNWVRSNNGDLNLQTKTAAHKTELIMVISAAVLQLCALSPLISLSIPSE